MGGIPATAPNPSDSVGLQYLKKTRGGFLGPHFKSKWGLPVINIPGCPCHPDWVTQILVAIASGRAKDIALDDLQRPQTFFKTFTQTGGTEPEFPFYDLMPGTVFKTQKIGGVVPQDHQTGTGTLTYLAHAAATKLAAPQWTKEDMFVVSCDAGTAIPGPCRNGRHRFQRFLMNQHRKGISHSHRH